MQCPRPGACSAQWLLSTHWTVKDAKCLPPSTWRNTVSPRSPSGGRGLAQQQFSATTLEEVASSRGGLFAKKWGISSDHIQFSVYPLTILVKGGEHSEPGKNSSLLSLQACTTLERQAERQAVSQQQSVTAQKPDDV